MVLAFDESDYEIYVTFAESKILGDDSVRRFGARLNEVLELAAERDKSIVFDWTDATYVSSAVIGNLLRFLRAGETRGVKIDFCAISSILMDAIRTLNLHDRFDDSS